MKRWSTPYGDMGNNVNYNGEFPLAVTKPSHMLEHPSIRRYCRASRGSDNPFGAGNQQETVFSGSSETARWALLDNASRERRYSPTLTATWGARQK